MEQQTEQKVEDQQQNKPEEVQEQTTQQEEVKDQDKQIVEIQEICDACRKPGTGLLACGGCREIKYCSKQCQKGHWNIHKKSCAYFKKKEKESLPLYKGIDWFDMEKNVGHGNFSEIWRARCKKDEKYYAIKTFERRRLRQINKEKDVEMEIHCLQRLEEIPYVINYYGNFSNEYSQYMQIELIEGGELWEKTRLFGLVSKPIFQYYFGTVIKAMSMIHDKGIIHRDLKAENILLTKDNQVKIIDFGTAADLQNPYITGSGQGGKGKKNYQHFVGTPNYMAPEQIRNRGSSYETDIYQLGSVAYQLWTGYTGFLEDTEYLIFCYSQEKDPIFLDCHFAEHRDLQDLIMKMLQKQMEDRITMDEIKKHEFFKGFDFDNILDYQYFAEQKLSDSDQFVQKIRTHLLENAKLYVEKIDVYNEHYKVFEDAFESNETLKSDKILEERVRVMKAQGQTLVDFDKYSFSWKQFSPNTE